MRVLTFALTLLFFLFLPHASYACSCVMMASGNPPCQSFWNSPVVFSGRVSEIKPFVLDKGSMKGYEQRLVRFAVSGDHRGNVGPAADVITGQGGGDCGYSFELNQDYLVYAYKGPDGVLSTGICSPTKRLDSAIDDLQFIGSLTSAKPVGSVFGQITEYKSRKSTDERRPNPTLPNVTLTVEGKAGRFETSTDENGKYRLSDILPGEYVLKFTAPEGLSPTMTEQKITIPEKGCVVRDFGVSRETSLSGRVLDVDGSPVAKLLVDLVPVDQINAPHQSDRNVAELDENGAFTFKGVAAGSYYLGIGLGRFTVVKHSFPKTFYPGTQNLASAGTVIVREGQILKNLDFRLPPPLIERKIEGVVVFPDGKPAANAYISLIEGGVNDAGYGESGADGHFILTVFEGLNYRIWAHVNLPNREQRHSQPVNLAAKGAVKNVKLTISEPGGSCIPCKDR